VQDKVNAKKVKGKPVKTERLVIQLDNLKMKRCIAVCFVLICNLLNAQVQFEARVSKTTLGLNERLRMIL
jgi:hypothetical protein